MLSSSRGGKWTDAATKSLAALLLELGIILGAILLAYGWNNFHPGQKRQYTIGTTYMTMNNVFYAILNEQLANSVSRHGDRLLTRDPSLEIDKQVKQIDEFIKEKST